jgi:hypothetical protein
LTKPQEQGWPAGVLVFSRTLLLEKHSARMESISPNPADAPDVLDGVAAQLAASAVSPPQKKRDADEDAKRDRSKRLGKGDDGKGVFKATPPKQPPSEARLVTPPNENVTRSLWAAPEPQPRHELAVQLAAAPAQRKAGLRERKAARKARYEELNLPYSPAPPLPDGATEEDRARLRREALNRYYGY